MPYLYYTETTLSKYAPIFIKITCQLISDIHQPADYVILSISYSVVYKMSKSESPNQKCQLYIYSPPESHDYLRLLAIKNADRQRMKARTI
jgi:hypothetical protein